MEESYKCHDTIVDPQLGRSSTGDSSGRTAGGPIDCRGDSEELTATLACGDAAVIGSLDVSHVNRLTVGLRLTSFGFPLHESACRPLDMEHILALVSKVEYSDTRLECLPVRSCRYTSTGLIETSKTHFYGRAAAELSFSEGIFRTFTRVPGSSSLFLLESDAGLRRSKEKVDGRWVHK